MLLDFYVELHQKASWRLELSASKFIPLDFFPQLVFEDQLHFSHWLVAIQKFW